MARIKGFVPKVTKEEFDRIRPKCNCPDHEEIPWKDYYRSRGIPKYIHGHENKGKKFTDEHKRKIGEASSRAQKGRPAKNKGMKYSDEVKRHMSDAQKKRYSLYGSPIKGRKCSEETKKRISESRKGKCCGKDNPFYGKHHTEERKMWYRNTQVGKKTRPRTEEEKRKISEGNNGKKMSEKTRQKISQYKKEIGQWRGENNPKFNNWSHYKPYCEKFNEAKKEEIRDLYDRKCFLCSLDEKDNKMKSGKVRKLSVHHIDGDKEQGCNGKRWELVPLCNKCHGRITKKSLYYMLHLINILMDLYLIKDVWTWWGTNI